MENDDAKKTIVAYLVGRGAKIVALFGSYVRGEHGPESDIDILVEFQETKGLLELIRMEQELSEELGIKVDLLTRGSISPYIMENIAGELEVVYG